MFESLFRACKSRRLFNFFGQFSAPLMKIQILVNLCNVLLFECFGTAIAPRWCKKYFRSSINKRPALLI